MCFLALPLVYRLTSNLHLSALISVNCSHSPRCWRLLYGGVSSPFLPWLIISLCSASSICRASILVVGYLPQYSWTLVLPIFMGSRTCPLQQLSKSLISILSATIYMSWMAIYYQYDCDALRLERKRRGIGTAIRLPKPKKWRRGQSREVDFSCQDESRIAYAAKCRDRIQ